jgi:enoyl-CoA hydratase/carnithine racemase
MGLVNRVWAADELLARTYDYAHQLAHEVSPRSLAETKRQVWVDQHRDVGSSVAEAAALLDEMMAEPAFREGVAALNEKRPPRF